MSSVITDTNTMSYDTITGSAGYSYTTNTTAAPVYTISTGTNGTGYWNFNNITNPVTISKVETGNVLTVKGDADFEGDITVNGKSLTKSLEAIEEKLAILHPNEKLEEKWENLRGLRKAYMELEAEIKEKEQIWNILKK